MKTVKTIYDHIVFWVGCRKLKMGCEYSKMHEFLKNHLNTDLWTIYQAIIKPRIWFERSSIGKTHAKEHVSSVWWGSFKICSFESFCRRIEIRLSLGSIKETHPNGLKISNCPQLKFQRLMTYCWSLSGGGKRFNRCFTYLKNGCLVMFSKIFCIETLVNLLFSFTTIIRSLTI